MVTCLDARMSPNYKKLTLWEIDALKWGWDSSTLSPPPVDQMFFGKSTVYADIDGDGIKDLLVGAHGYGRRGSIFIFFLNSTQGIKNVSQLRPGSAGIPFFFPQYFGKSFALYPDAVCPLLYAAQKVIYCVRMEIMFQNWLLDFQMIKAIQKQDQLIYFC